MPLHYHLLTPADAHLFSRIAPEVFDEPPQSALIAEFLADARHHMVVAMEEGTLVGFVSAVHYIHPDKPAELWINEIGVSSEHRQQGIAIQLMNRMLDHGRTLGCREAWVLTEKDNIPARKLYARTGGKEWVTPPVYVEFNLEDR